VRQLWEKLRAGEAVVAGVSSGTSADGIDVALVRFPVECPGELARPRLLAYSTEPFPAELLGRVRAALGGEAVGLRETALLSRDLGRAFGAAARALARRSGLQLDLVGSHGQTVWHHDGEEPSGAASLQLGDGDFAAEEAGCAVVSDFRSRDMAAGGEGAPIAALADSLLFADLPRPAAILNLGGMANLTLLPEPGGELMSFDTGPAGSLLDGLARRFLGEACDRDGACAARGRPSPALVAELLAHPFFDRPPPRSTGRDTFGEAWVERVVERARAVGVLDGDSRPEDLLASAADLVAAAIAGALERFAPPGIGRVVASGGGVHNRALVGRLSERIPVPVASALDFGVDPDAREALAFAWLAARCVLGRAVTVPSATGALAGRVLGKISPPARSLPAGESGPGDGLGRAPGPPGAGIRRGPAG